MVGIPELVPVFFAGEVVSILKSSDAADAKVASWAVKLPGVVVTVPPVPSSNKL